MSEENAAYNVEPISTAPNRLTKRIFEHVYYTMGAYSETIPAECTPQDVREILKRLAVYEDIGSIEEINLLLCSDQAWRERVEHWGKATKHWQGRFDTTVDSLINVQEQLKQAVEMLEWYGNESNHERVTYPSGKGFETNSEVSLDNGRSARDFLSSLSQGMEANHEGNNNSSATCDIDSDR